MKKEEELLEKLYQLNGILINSHVDFVHLYQIDVKKINDEDYEIVFPPMIYFDRFSFIFHSHSSFWEH